MGAFGEPFGRQLAFWAPLGAPWGVLGLPRRAEEARGGSKTSPQVRPGDHLESIFDEFCVDVEAFLGAYVHIVVTYFCVCLVGFWLIPGRFLVGPWCVPGRFLAGFW